MASKVRLRPGEHEVHQTSIHRVLERREALQESLARILNTGVVQVLTFVVLDVSASMHRALDYARRSLTVFLTSKVVPTLA